MLTPDGTAVEHHSDGRNRGRLPSRHGWRRQCPAVYSRRWLRSAGCKSSASWTPGDQLGATTSAAMGTPSLCVNVAIAKSMLGCTSCSALQCREYGKGSSSIRQRSRDKRAAPCLPPRAQLPVLPFHLAVCRRRQHRARLHDNRPHRRTGRVERSADRRPRPGHQRHVLSLDLAVPRRRKRRQHREGPSEPPIDTIACPSTSLCLAGDWDGNVLASSAGRVLEGVRLTAPGVRELLRSAVLSPARLTVRSLLGLRRVVVRFEAPSAGRVSVRLLARARSGRVGAVLARSQVTVPTATPLTIGVRLTRLGEALLRAGPHFRFTLSLKPPIGCAGEVDFVGLGGWRCVFAGCGAGVGGDGSLGCRAGAFWSGFRAAVSKAWQGAAGLTGRR